MNIYSFFPLIGAVSAFFLGIVALAKNINSRLNQIFSLFIFSVVIWLFASFMMLSSTTEGAAIFWDKIVYAAVVFIPILFYHFTLLFTENIKNKKFFIYLGYFIFLFFSILSTTDYFISGLYKYNWGVHAQAKPLHTIFLAFFAFYIVLAFLNIYFFQRKAAGIQKNQANYILFTFFIIAITSFAFLPAYGIDIIFPFPYITAFLCVLVLFFAIVKYHLLGIRVITTELFIFIIWVASAIKIFFSNDSQDFFINTGLFIAIFFVGILLARSILKEVKQREQIEKLAKEIQQAYEVEKWAKEQTEKAYEAEKQAKERTEEAYEVEKKAKEELEYLDKAKNQFLLTIQHHLRTPLTSMMGYADLILKGVYGKQSKETREVIQKFCGSTNSLIKMVNEFLDITQFQLGKEVVMLKQDIQMGPMMEEIVNELKFQADTKKIYLKIEKPKELPPVKGDTEKLKAALYNIFDNAIKYTQKGGVEIKLKVENEELKTDNTGGENKILIEVKDTGIGMTKERMQKLFNSTFERGEHAKKEFVTGRGIGLYIASQIIKAHKGRVWAESEGEGNGSTFFIELPAG